jgi:hypothetical protein
MRCAELNINNIIKIWLDRHLSNFTFECRFGDFVSSIPETKPAIPHLPYY